MFSLLKQAQHPKSLVGRWLRRSVLTRISSRCGTVAGLPVRIDLKSARGPTDAIGGLLATSAPVLTVGLGSPIRAEVLLPRPEWS